MYHDGAVMFANKPVLYQLAYISSGTAVGVGILCAEERRRRSQIVQKIADNARRIRQSPRHYQNAAVAAHEGNEYELSGEELSWRTEGVTGQKHGERQICRQGKDGGAMQGPELPSAVENGYAQVRSHARRSGYAKQRHVLSTPSEDRRAINSERGGPSAIMSPPSYSIRGAKKDGTGSQRTASRQREVVYKTLREIRHHASIQSPRRTPLRRNQDGTTPSGSAIQREDFRTSPAWASSGDNPSLMRRLDLEPSLIKVSLQDIDDDVELFFSRASTAHLHREALHNLFDIASQLVPLALEHGTLSQVRSLALWKLANNGFTAVDIASICDMCRASSQRFDTAELFDFYAEVFTYCRAENSYLELRLHVLMEALDWNLDATPSERAQALLGHVPELEKDLYPLVETECRKLLAAKDLSRATNLVVALQDHFGCETELEVIVHQVFSTALDTRHLSLCGRLLRMNDKFAASSEGRKRAEDFLSICDTHEAYGLILDLFSNAPSTRLDQLSAKSNEILAFACTKAVPMPAHLSGLFSKALRETPKHMRTRILDNMACSQLKETWRSTHNLFLVRRELERQTKWLQKNGDEPSRHALTLAAVEIYIKANKYGRALQTLSDLHRLSSEDGEVVSLAALMFAKKGAWKAFEHLLTSNHISIVFTSGSDLVRRFNNIIHLYSQQYSAVETWKFVTGLIEDRDFRPDTATTNIMLQAFVSWGAIELIPDWFHYLDVLGHHTELSTKMAANVLTHFYLRHRPSHVLIMWLCRNVVNCAPSLAGPEFGDLVKEAIGYDVREAEKSPRGSRNHSNQEHAELRIWRLAETRDPIPSPGYMYDGQLYFHHPDAQRLSAQRCKTPSHEEPVPPELAVMAHGNSTDTVIRGDDMAVDAMASKHGKPEELTFLKPATLLHGMQADGSVGELNDPLTSKGSAESCDAQKKESLQAEQSALDYNLPSVVQFNDLRPMYHVSELQRDEGDWGDFELRPIDRKHPRPRGPALERDMVLALSLGYCDKVLDLYHASLDADGVPASPLVLEIAIESSMRKGDEAEASNMLARAKAAGMNITCAIGPMIIHRMKNLSPGDREKADRLRRSTIEYYRLNDKNGWPVAHHVGVTAASTLIKNDCAEYGINLLDAIYRSEWVARRPLDIVALSVFLQGYTRMKHLDGVKWVVETVLAQGMRIDSAFLRVLKRSRGQFGIVASPASAAGGEMARVAPPKLLFQHWIRQCNEQRAKQRSETKALGRKLVKTLVKCANQQRHAVVEAANPLQHRREQGPSGMSNSEYAQWLKQHRAFLRQDIVMEDGTRAAFRLCLAPDRKRRNGRQDSGARVDGGGSNGHVTGRT